nr:hypothetical protein [Tanacetum cinerariifolium]
MRRVGKGFSGVETPLFKNMLEVREVDVEEEVHVPAQDDVDQENVTEEIADDVAQPTSPLPPSPVIPSSPPHQSPRPPPPQAAEGLETANTAQQLEILKLKARVKKFVGISLYVTTLTELPLVIIVSYTRVLENKGMYGIIVGYNFGGDEAERAELV